LIGVTGLAVEKGRAPGLETFGCAANAAGHVKTARAACACSVTRAATAVS
jgi:hypothetical protein